MDAIEFQQRLLTWFDVYGRKDLPWQQNVTPYRVWISEIMLQQTQVSTVIPYFQRFVERFPTLESLAVVSLDEVLPYWSGLGYYARARNLYRTAQIIQQEVFFPNTLSELIALPGIGQSTAGAILSIAFNKSYPILDGNVKRVLTRYKGIGGWIGYSAINQQLWAISKELTPKTQCAKYTQAIMDLGATLCTRSKPLCSLCPFHRDCVAYTTNSIALLPTPRPTKSLPSKQVFFLLLKNQQQQIYLQKRPPVGIWGGLWSLPEVSTLDEIGNFCISKNLRVINQHVLTTLRHTFSHYHLDYTPVLIEVRAMNDVVIDVTQTAWFYAKQINALALAAPIKRLLQQNDRE